MDFDVTRARERCLAYRRRILDMSQRVTAMHIAPAFSCLEMIDVIYHGYMRRSPVAGGEPFADSFVLSKGHGCISQYVILEDLEVLSRKELDAYCTVQGHLGAHPDYGVPGIEASTGSLGHGLGIAVGMAYAEKLKQTDRRVFALISDGELQEGSTWEGVLMASNLKLDNLVLFVDLNDYTAMDRLSVEHPATYPVDEKFRAFGWEATQVNGHDAGALVASVDSRSGKTPFVVIGQTVKGKGVAFMEGVPIWHYRSPSKEEYLLATQDLRQVTA